jgi:hypothetical protein
MAALERLSLRGTAVSGPGLRCLSGLRLRELWLTATDLDDAGLEYLKELRWLEKLDVAETRVTVEGVDEVRKALPKCDIRVEQTFPDGFRRRAERFGG